MFVWGSVLFFPAMATRANRGAWVFFIASLMYVAVTGHDFLEVVRRRASLPRPLAIWDRFEAWAGISYLVGSVLFAVGSVFFMSGVGRFDAGALCFVVGSLLFVCGAVVNVLQVVQRAGPAHPAVHEPHGDHLRDRVRRCSWSLRSRTCSTCRAPRPNEPSTPSWRASTWSAACCSCSAAGSTTGVPASSPTPMPSPGTADDPAVLPSDGAI